MAYGYIYKITINNPNSGLDQHFYIGQHRKSAFDDKYFGSGLKIKNYVKKYGTKNLLVEIIEWASDEDNINQLEEKHVNNHLDTELCLNLVGGGKYRTWSLESRKKASMNMLGMKNHRYGTHHTEESKRYLSSLNLGRRHSAGTIQQIKNTKRINPYIYTDDARKRMSEKAKITKNATGYKWTDKQIRDHKSRLILAERNNKKILNEDLPVIERMLKSGVLQRDIAKKYGVASHTVSWAKRVRIPEFKKIRPEIFYE